MPITFASPNTVAKPRTTLGKLRSASRLTTRRGILAAYFCATVLIASLGAYATRSIGMPGDLTDQTLRGSLPSLSGASAPSASSRLGPPADAAVQDTIQPSGRILAQALDAKVRSLLWIAAAVTLAGVLMTLIARRVMAALANLSAAIRRSEAGEFDLNVPYGSVDRAGALRTTIGTMRANIIAMTALEAASRQPSEVGAGATKRSNGPAIRRKRGTATAEPTTSEGT